MKLNLLLFTTLVLAHLTLFSQKSSMGEIDIKVKVIKESLVSFEKKELQTFQNSSKVVYFKNDAIQLISVTEKGKVEKCVEWFYSNDLLLYTETNWRDSSSLKPLFKEKTYHTNGNMIAWIDNENSFVDSSSPTFKKLEKELNAYAIKIRNEALE